MNPQEQSALQVSSETASRRDFLMKGAAAGLALLPFAGLIGCSDPKGTVNSVADQDTTGFSSGDVAILATGYNTEVQASATYVAAAGLTDAGGSILKEPFLGIALQFKADHDAHAQAFLSLYNASKTSRDPVLNAPAGNLLTAFPAKSTFPLNSETNILIYALGLEILAAQVYSTLATGTASAGYSKFAVATGLPAVLSISRTNLVGIAAAADIAACDMQHAIALRAAITLFKAQSATTFILRDGGVKPFNPADANSFPDYFGSSVTAQNPNDYLA